MRIKYDFHIHTALSPCALNEMTPNNIVNMAILNELDAIAVTDHNSGKNLSAVLEVAKQTELIVLPGMEVESREEIHVVCLFSSLSSVYKMQTLVYDHLPKLKNRSKVLGEQLILDVNDEIVAKEDQLLSFASDLSFETILSMTRSIGGIAFPAHIDRPSYSVLSNLGMLPPDADITCLEISQYADYDQYKLKYPKHFIIQSSDAHELGYIGICNRYMELECENKESITAQMLIDYLRMRTVI